MKKIIFVILIFVLVFDSLIILGLNLLRNVGKNVAQNRILEIGEGENVEVLNRLNDEWELSENYSLEIVEENGLVLELQDGQVCSEIGNSIYTSTQFSKFLIFLTITSFKFNKFLIQLLCTYQYLLDCGVEITFYQVF